MMKQGHSISKQTKLKNIAAVKLPSGSLCRDPAVWLPLVVSEFEKEWCESGLNMQERFL